ncbi:MAG: M23 family metallopeptidase [Actinomycetota bacterium]|nr:M23 family metallopeptidase [Actinomycetota bacterium]
MASKLLSVAAMIFAGALAVGTSLPANAFYPAGSASASAGSIAGSSVASGVGVGSSSSAGSSSSSSAAGLQSAAVDVGQAIDAGTRDDFQVFSWAQVLAQKYAQVNNYTFSGGRGAVRWPFPSQVPISSPYGPRIAPCGGCSTFHNGVDFTPGAGAAIFAIADGVVTAREDGTSEYGNFVIITHKIGRDTVTSTYAHMLAGSSAIVLGQTIHVGDFLGLVGMTGEATGPHLHFEIAVNGARTDPIPWLESHVS